MAHSLYSIDDTIESKSAVKQQAIEFIGQKIQCRAQQFCAEFGKSLSGKTKQLVNHSREMKFHHDELVWNTKIIISSMDSIRI